MKRKDRIAAAKDTLPLIKVYNRLPGVTNPKAAGAVAISIPLGKYGKRMQDASRADLPVKVKGCWLNAEGAAQAEWEITVSAGPSKDANGRDVYSVVVNVDADGERLIHHKNPDAKDVPEGWEFTVDAVTWVDSWWGLIEHSPPGTGGTASHQVQGEEINPSHRNASPEQSDISAQFK